MDSLRKSLLPPAVYASKTAYQEPYPLLMRALVAHAVPEALELLEQIPTERLRGRDSQGRTIACQAVLNDCDERILKVVLALKPIDEEEGWCTPIRGRVEANPWTQETPWNIACRLGKRAIIQHLIEPKLLAEVCYDDQSALHVACQADAEAGALLLAETVDNSNINCQNKGYTPLDLAFLSGKEEVAISLLARRLDTDLSPASIECAKLVKKAARYRFEQVCLFLSEIVAPFLYQDDLDKEERLNNWALASFAAICGHMHKAFDQLILHLPEDVKGLSSLEQRLSRHLKFDPLLATAADRNNTTAMVALMDRYGTDPHWMTYFIKNAPVHMAVAAGAVDACKELIQRLPAADLLHRNNRGLTALHLAECRTIDRIEAYKVLLQAVPKEAFGISSGGYHLCDGIPYCYHLSNGHVSIALDILKAMPQTQLRGIPMKNRMGFTETCSLLVLTAGKIGNVKEVPVEIAILLRERMLPADFDTEAEKARSVIEKKLKWMCWEKPGIRDTCNDWLSVLSSPLRAKAAE